ncbi:MAG: penicillin-binding protein 2 [Microbacteriaceae bacterium]|nr:penicillin-binding protein 2 [Microbacteriaceae bacterium]
MQSVFMTRRRVLFGAILVVALIAAFVIRLVDIQVVRAGEINKQADGRRVVTSPIYGERGTIYDANGQVLGETVIKYNITAAPNNVMPFSSRRLPDGTVEKIPLEQVVNELSEIVQVPADQIMSAITTDPEANFAYIAKRVDFDTYQRVKELGISWLYSEQVPTRIYPKGAVAGNIVGFLNEVGGTGVENFANQCLQAVDGSETYERSADGVRIPGSDIVVEQAQDGGDVTLTIDADLQWFVQQALQETTKELGAKWSMAIVMEVETGKLRAVAEYPVADPNYPGATEAETWTSRSFTYLFEPGSTFKSLTTAMMLDAGVLTPTTKFSVPGKWQPRTGVNVTDSWNHGTLQLTTAGILIKSSNIGTSQMADLMSKEDRYNYFKKFGIGTKTDSGFLGETHGSLAKAANWDNQSNYTIMFGQGVSVTAVQLASAYQAIGNEGLRLPVQLVENCTLPSGEVIEPEQEEPVQVVSPGAANTTINILENLVNNSWLTSRLQIDGYRVAVKTGTAEVAKGGKYVKGLYVTSNAGLFPAEDPKYVVIAVMGEPTKDKTSGAVSPLWKQIATHVIKHYKIAPSTTKSPTIAQEW